MSRPGPTSLHNFDHGFRSQILFTQPAQLAVCACWATFFRRQAGILQLTCTHSSRGSAARTIIDLFTNTAAILSLLDLRSIMGYPGGHSLTIYAGFSGKKRTSMYISRKKGDRYCSQRRHNDLFFSLHFFLGKLKERLARKARVNMRSCSRPPGHPIILLKSN